ncbi:MAG: hypothetical protein HXX08_23700 [Chloroflexi bacterium]|uniref:Uncharacterized protein n=1 Tax=Candidatus Chlorohelix allophototropha TaxID=3003348 RepID=A0A8T7MA25_9CHLR|nr:hypothetical protein [Chloroflexota bacterium]WJW68808.1 hypothetical protein OZ401_004426 [Chloroflexota bacterium L227-S17]
MNFIIRAAKENPVLWEINRLEEERAELLMRDYLSRTDRARLTELRDRIADLWEKRRHEKDPYYEKREYSVSTPPEDEMFFRDNRRGPRLRTRLPKGDRDAA